AAILPDTNTIGSRIIDLGGTTRTFTATHGTGSSTTFDGNIAVSMQNGSLAKASSGSLQLAASNTLSGVTTIAAGPLAVSVASALGSAPNVLIQTGSQLNISGPVGTLTGTFTALGSGSSGTPSIALSPSLGPVTINGQVSPLGASTFSAGTGSQLNV